MRMRKTGRQTGFYGGKLKKSGFRKNPGIADKEENDGVNTIKTVAGSNG